VKKGVLMEKVKLGQSDMEVSALCLGTDSIGSRIERKRSFDLMDLYQEKGGNFIDTANFYASWLPGCKGGESESAIGAWMSERGNRDRIVVASKVAFDYPGCAGGLSGAEIERECEKSLQRLRTDRIDLYYAHRDDFDTGLEETMGAFDRLINAGKVRMVGASNLSVWRIAEANSVSKANGWPAYGVVEQRYTYLRPRHGADFGPQICISDELKDYANRKGISLVAYSVLLQGAYTRADREIPAQYAGSDAEERMSALKDVAKEVGATLNQVIIAWMRQSEPAVLPIIAGSKQEQLEETIGALNVRLSQEQMRTLDTAGNPDIKEAWIR
jgi:aryl-alcohol dehydrogenase-like predicted oxidoreductase